jgi:hypothetical protein
MLYLYTDQFPKVPHSVRYPLALLHPFLTLARSGHSGLDLDKTQGTLLTRPVLTSSYQNIQSSNSTGYWELMHQLFNADLSAHDAGLSFLRVSLGASDLSPARSSMPLADLGKTFLTRRMQTTA